MSNTKKEPASAPTETSPKVSKDTNTTTINDTPKSGICQDFSSAEDKISAEYKADSKKLTAKGNAVAEAVLNALTDFCRQNSEFAQAVMQSDKPVTDCINSTVAKCGNSISDLEVYRKAVQFYFAGADVHMKLTVDLGDGGFSNAPEQPPITVSSRTSVELSLDSLLDF